MVIITKCMVKNVYRTHFNSSRVFSDKITPSKQKLKLYLSNNP